MPHRTDVPLRARVDDLRQAAAALTALADEPPPTGLPPEALRELERHAAWLRDASARLLALAAQGEAATPAQQRDQSLRFLALQNALQNESRRYQTLSNALAARHEAARNTIDNLR